MREVQNKIVIVTGAAQGIGAATARHLVAEGAYVVIADINTDAGPALAGELGERARFAELDVRDEPGWSRVASETFGDHGRIDGLVNNAGVFTYGLLESVGAEEFRRCVDTNLYGPWLGMKAVSPYMKRAGSGSIVNISSVDGLIGYCARTVYTATKWGLRGMTYSVAKELGPYGIRANVVAPGAIDTPMLRGGMAGAPFDDLFPEIAMNRPGDPSEVARATTFLLGDNSRYVSGTDLVVDGGWVCGDYLLDKPSGDRAAPQEPATA